VPYQPNQAERVFVKSFLGGETGVKFSDSTFSSGIAPY